MRLAAGLLAALGGCLPAESIDPGTRTLRAKSRAALVGVQLGAPSTSRSNGFS